eukprot:jgi/Chrpa1/25442/Chrysochromulina_OHIO_Genome00000889-RA
MTNAIQLEPRHTGWRHAALTGAVLPWAFQALRWALQALRWALQALRWALQALRWALQALSGALQALLVLGRVRSDALC